MLGKGARDANPGSKKVVRKSMEMKSNTKNVPVTPVMKPIEKGMDNSVIRKDTITKPGHVKM